MQGKDTSANYWQTLCASPYSMNWRLRASTASALFLKLPLDLQTPGTDQVHTSPPR